MEKTLLIINPVAGKNKLKTTLYHVVEKICTEEENVTVKFTRKSLDAKEFAISAANDSFSKIICLGGDGTLNEVVSGVMEANSNIPIGYIPAGSTNDFSRSVGLETNLLKATNAAVFGKKTAFDVGSFNNDRFFTYIASFGAFTSTSYSAPQSIKNALGHLAYILEGVKDIAKIKPCHCKITFDGGSFEDDYIFGAVSNATSVGGVVKLDPQLVDMNDGFFELALVKVPKTIVDLNNIITSITLSDFSNGAIEFVKTTRVTFEFDEDISWSLDGEFASGGKRPDTKNIKSAINLIR